MHRLLIVEDDALTRRHLEAIFRNDGYDVLSAADGNQGLRRAREDRPDLIVLDWELPKRSGYEVCVALRQEGNPARILILTGVRTDDEDEVRALRINADDYVKKSQSDLVLLERVRKLLRRTQERELRLPDTLRFADVDVNFRAREVRRAGLPVMMRPKEFGVLRYLAARAGEAVSRYDLLRDVWRRPNAGSDRSIDNAIVSLRKKLERNPGKPERLIKVPTVGYKFAQTPDVSMTFGEERLWIRGIGS